MTSFFHPGNRPASQLGKNFNPRNSSEDAGPSTYANTPPDSNTALQSSNLHSSILNSLPPAPGAKFPTRGSTALPAPTLRPDLASIAEMIPAGVSVLDLGCGEGELLEYLVRVKQAKGRGIELSETGVLACVRRGLSVRQGNLQEGLADYPDASFDYVTLAQTLPYLDDPSMILHEMLRVGRRGVISFPNLGYWRCRLQLLLTGRMPPAPDLPQEWFDIPRWQAFTVTDFARATVAIWASKSTNRSTWPMRRASACASIKTYWPPPRSSASPNAPRSATRDALPQHPAPKPVRP